MSNKNERHQKKTLERCLRPAKISVGEKNVLSALLTANPKLILISGNCPTELREQVIYYSMLSNVPYSITEETSMELGSVCGKPFSASVVAIMDAGESDILSKIKKDPDKKR